MSFLRRIVWIFVSPQAVFADIREGSARWWHAWIVLAAIYLIVGYYGLPIQMAVLENNPNDLPQEQLDQQIEILQKYGIVQVVATPLVMLLVGLAVAGVTYVLVSVLSSRARFGPYFTLTLYASIIGAVSQIISVAVIHGRGIETIRGPDDAYVSIGLGFLAPDGNALVKSAFISLEFFGVWAIVFLAMGLMGIFGMSRGQAIAAVVPWWLISVLVVLVGQLTGGLG